ncbi:hypothetical protein GGR52DRAFT_202658 [Hypoxylon sp. FL1284]|nr:hypothetical protein GGR52DRAFT_202658 [Hypoxylon sp. FL1284]
MARIPSFAGAFKKPTVDVVCHIVALIFLAAAFALFVAVDVTSPVTHGLALFTARNDYISIDQGSPVVHFGTFGDCVQKEQDRVDLTQDLIPDQCSSSGVGYDPYDALTSVSPNLHTTTRSREEHLTSAMVLHPLITGLTFAILAASLLPSRLSPPIVAGLLASLTCLLAAAAVVCDFVLFSRLRSALRDARDAAVGSYASGIWAVLAGTLCLCVATALYGVLMLRHRRRQQQPWGTALDRGTPFSDLDARKMDSASAAATSPSELGGRTVAQEVAGGERYELGAPAGSK